MNMMMMSFTYVLVVLALACSGMIWARYSTVITPVKNHNYSIILVFFKLSSYFYFILDIVVKRDNITFIWFIDNLPLNFELVLD